MLDDNVFFTMLLILNISLSMVTKMTPVRMKCEHTDALIKLSTSRDFKADSVPPTYQLDQG